ncbi:hypothetical protein MNEG_5532 [Monoraphidium neglectum]|uniref:F-box/LRR-repeat protein 2 n=1 Tax=Monoraphidium neglectum TaxID=145388 RepID=A0A0D2NA05_9CHLO|nr:hypothetical protein MNEG_5532 [Monoraphidium neglectum]KIZ02431.1 hypothetical protein MNEG_5532 [Monoraphidium neglectum]|eukprot:XP_013901450.1 hypothetical protein MNEG_5532 [Monoraphidium neglectum]
MAGCAALDDAGAAAAAAALGARLRRLDLSGCERVGEGGAAALLAAAAGLRSLSLAGNRNVGARTLAAAARLRHLRRLDAALCCGVDDAALARLAACPSLADVNVRACWRLSEQGIHALLTRSTSIVSLNVEGCHRLFGCQGAVPTGFDPQQDPRRPGVLSRRPPGAEPVGAGAGTERPAAAAGQMPIVVIA